MTRPLILDHTIVNAQALTNFKFDKTREWAGCRLCGAIFQPTPNPHTPDPLIQVWEAALEIKQWRDNHNKTHDTKEQLAFLSSGLTMTPEAAHKLAPFGVVPVADAFHPQYADEINQALFEAPRAPLDDAETSTLRTKKGT